MAFRHGRSEIFGIGKPGNMLHNLYGKKKKISAQSVMSNMKLLAYFRYISLILRFSSYETDFICCLGHRDFSAARSTTGISRFKEKKCTYQKWRLIGGYTASLLW